MKINALRISAATLLAAGTLIIAKPAFTQAPPPGAAAPPAGAMLFPGTPNPAAAPAGVYTLDHEHHNVEAHIFHRKLSYNVVRFGATSGELTWDPAKPEAIKLDVTLASKTYHDPIVYLIQPESGGMLASEKYPTIRFVSTSVKKTGDRTADVNGQLTLRGVTLPATIKAELLGAGTSPDGASASIGFAGTMEINWDDFAGKDAAKFGIIKIELGAEFHKKKA